MKITKLAHACLLVEMPEPVNRTVLFDPGMMSAQLVRDADLRFLDDIVITHEHFDHFDLDLVKELAGRFPDVRILAPQPITDKLAAEGIAASSQPPEGMELFDSPHEQMLPIGEQPPAEMGVHYLGLLSHPGDSHSFKESKRILALPVDAPWGTTVKAAQLATDLKPDYVIPIHDWMWRDEWRKQFYDNLGQYFQGQGITFIKPIDGEPFTLDV